MRLFIPTLSIRVCSLPCCKLYTVPKPNTKSSYSTPELQNQLTQGPNLQKSFILGTVRPMTVWSRSLHMLNNGFPICVVVKIMVPFWVPIKIRHLLFRVPPKGTIILTTTPIIPRIWYCNMPLNPLVINI